MNAPLSPQHKILIVEDEAAIALELETRLESMGHTVIGPVATSARALELAQREHPDLALMDINIAGPTDGVDTATQLRTRFDIPVIFVTAYTNPEMVTRAKPAQPLGWIVKPFNERELQVTIELATHRAANDRRLREHFASYANNLAQQLLREFSGHTGSIALHIEGSGFNLGVTETVPCTLIINELLTNSFKHAFPGGRAGTVSIRLGASADGTRLLWYSDDGIGLPGDGLPGAGHTTGMQIIARLVGQLQATFVRKPAPAGIHYHLSIPPFSKA